MTVVGGPAFITSTQSNSHMRSVKILFIYTAILPTTQHDMFPSYWQTHWVLEVNVIQAVGLITDTESINRISEGG